MKGGASVFDIAKAVIGNIYFTFFLHKVHFVRYDKTETSDDNHPEVDSTSPTYFKMGKMGAVMSIDDDIIIITIDDNHPIRNTGTGAATNSKAVRVLWGYKKIYHFKDHECSRSQLWRGKGVIGAGEINLCWEKYKFGGGTVYWGGATFPGGEKRPNFWLVRGSPPIPPSRENPDPRRYSPPKG